ncbi:MAG: DUF2029 domain-containing protein [Candidatus Levybacteria bacterium]|nr:DUF2029 domain-containing protein [Candidatus Levybacteria bacterium]
MKDLKKFLLYILGSKLVILGFLIYFLFNISALKTNWLDFFFFGSSLHYCCQGIDFYGIPNGVYSFINGGELSGANLPESIKPYSSNTLSNPNDYHPITALIIGSMIIIFDPNLSFYYWMIVKILITIPIVYYLYKNFSDNKFINLAIFIFLANFSQYSEIRISQYQFIFNISLLLLLISLVKKKEELERGILFFLTLIAKPISLLFFPVLIIKKYYIPAILGISIFLASTTTFNVLNIGNYFTDNLAYHLLNPKEGKSIDFMSLEAFLRYTFNVSPDFIKYLKYITLISIYLMAFNKKTHVLTLIFLLSAYFLFFYDHLFQYHFSILGAVLPICLLTLPNFQTRLVKILILTTCIPTVFFLLRLLNFEFIMDPVYGPNPTINGWQITSFFQLLPVVILSVIIFIKEIPLPKIGTIKNLKWIK